MATGYNRIPLPAPESVGYGVRRPKGISDLFKCTLYPVFAAAAQKPFSRLTDSGWASTLVLIAWAVQLVLIVMAVALVALTVTIPIVGVIVTIISALSFFGFLAVMHAARRDGTFVDAQHTVGMTMWAANDRVWMVLHHWKTRKADPLAAQNLRRLMLMRLAPIAAYYGVTLHLPAICDKITQACLADITWAANELGLSIDHLTFTKPSFFVAPATRVVFGMRHSPMNLDAPMNQA